MRIDIRRLRAGSAYGENTFDFSYALDLSGVRLWGEKPFPEPVRIEGAAIVRADVVTLSYTAAYTRHGACSRCLSPVNEEVAEGFEHIVLESEEGEDAEYESESVIPAPGGILDMDGLAASDILLSLEGALLCSPSCKGLCLK